MDAPELTSDDFAEFLKVMPEKMGVRMEKFPNGDFKVTKIAPKDFKELGDRPGLFHVIYQSSRPGAGYFSNYLEHKYFPPETPANDEFQFITYKWLGMLWGIISIPIEKKSLAYEAAEVSKMRIADGIPMKAGFMVGATRKDKLGKELEPIVEWFPLDCDNAYTLEFARDSDVFEPGGIQDQKIWEDFKVKQLWKEFDVPGHDDPWK
jgi:hypothetical protein